MESMIARLERSTLIQAIVYIVLGGLILGYPRLFFDTIVYLVSGYFLLLGLWALFQGFRQRMNGLPPTFFVGLLYLLFALLLVFFAPALASLLPLLLGILFLFGGLIRLIQALGFRRTMPGRWSWFLVGSLIWIGVGLLLILNPFASLLVLFQLFGGVLIAIGLIELVLYSLMRSTKRQRRM